MKPTTIEIKQQALETARKLSPNSIYLEIMESFILEFPPRADRQELRKEILKDIKAGKENFEFFHQADIICSKFPSISVTEPQKENLGHGFRRTTK